MNKLAFWIFLFAAVLIGAGAYAYSNTQATSVRDSARPASTQVASRTTAATLPDASNLKSFEFLGCSGDWEEEKIQPQAWRPGSRDKVTILVRHPADCGYTIGTDPMAKVSGSKIELSYSMSNDTGALAACYCEYWATFELKSPPQHITSISINGDDARLMSGLNER